MPFAVAAPPGLAGGVASGADNAVSSDCWACSAQGQLRQDAVLGAPYRSSITTSNIHHAAKGAFRSNREHVPAMMTLAAHLALAAAARYC